MLQTCLALIGLIGLALATAHGMLSFFAVLTWHLRRLIAQAQPHLAVCSYNEIAPGINVETVGVIHA